MNIPEDVWSFYQNHLGYSDEEMVEFRDNPRNADVISKAPALIQKTIVIEIIESHGCASHHKAGDKIYFDGSGNLLTKLAPKRICFGLMHSIPPLIAAGQELFYAGADPNDMRFKRAACSDVSLKCGGWGRVVMEFKFEDRKKVEKE